MLNIVNLMLLCHVVCTEVHHNVQNTACLSSEKTSKFGSAPKKQHAVISRVKVIITSYEAAVETCMIVFPITLNAAMCAIPGQWKRGVSHAKMSTAYWYENTMCKYRHRKHAEKESAY